MPDVIKNHPWNLKAVERSVHQRIHGNDPAGETFNVIEKLWYGSPTWAKGAAGSVGSGISADSIVGEE